MKIDSSTLTYIQNVVKTAELVKIGNIIIEPGKIRAVDEDRTVVLFQDTDVPDMAFGSIGLNRIDVFSSRFDMTKSMENFQMEAIVENVDTSPFVRALLMKGKGIKVDYRCANPQTIQAPKNINDAVKYSTKMTAEAVLIMQKGQSAMSATDVTIKCTDNIVSLEMSDINCDVMSYQFGNNVSDVSDDTTNDISFEYSYPIKTILPLFKNNPEVTFFITSRGMLKIPVNGLNIYVLPKAQ